METKEEDTQKIMVQGHASFWMENDGILHCKLSNLNVNNRLDSRTARLYIDAILRLSKGEPMPLLIDLREARGTFSNAAAKLLSKSFERMPCVLREAYVVDSLSVKILVHAYKRIFKTRIPYSLFKDMASAREYCLESKS